MLMTRTKVGLRGFLLLTLFLIIFAIPVYASSFQIASVDESKRLYGDDRYQTALAIAEQINNGAIDCVVLAPSTNFANALPASVLAHKNNAPLLLVNSTAKKTKEAFDYINSHLRETGKIYLVGDTSLIGNDFITELKNLGYQNVIRVSGKDKYETDFLVASELGIPDNSPVVISSGEKFPDAMTVSSFAAANGWPILLTTGKDLTNNIKNYIRDKQPSEIYITGGEEAISKSLEEELKGIVQNTKITRLAGKDRYETALIIAKHFAPDPQNIYIASGTSYIDSLAGSVLAAKSKGPIILIDPSTKRFLPSGVIGFMAETRKRKANTKLFALGGPVVVPEEIFTLASELGGNLNLTSHGHPVEFSYTIEKDSRWWFSRGLIEHEGELTEEQEMALLTAVKFYNEWLSIDYRTVDDSTFGYQYATRRFIQAEKERINNSRDLFNRQSYVNRVEKLTVTSIGLFSMLQETPYTYVRIRGESEAYNADIGVSIKRSDTYLVCLYNIHGYWEVDLVQ